MKKQEQAGRGLLFSVLLAVAVFCLLDYGMCRSNWIPDSGFFRRNDFEVTQKKHPEAVWDGVIFGSSELISGYREDLSSAGYVNLGMEYGVITDLEVLLEDGYIQVGQELVLALNWGVLCDGLDTDPTYIWKRGALEPYCYFQRNRLSRFLRDNFSALIGSGEPRKRVYLEQEKSYYHGHMSQQELEDRVKSLNERFFSDGTEGFSENLAALSRVFAWCAEHGVQVRAFWMPENPTAPMGEKNDAVKALALAQCRNAGVAVCDMTDAIAAECFHDTGHIEYDDGSAVFTEVLDQWLLS